MSPTKAECHIQRREILRYLQTRCRRLKVIARQAVSNRVTELERLRDDLLSSITLLFDTELKTVRDLEESAESELDQLASELVGLESVVQSTDFGSTRAARMLLELPLRNFEGIADSVFGVRAEFGDKLQSVFDQLSSSGLFTHELSIHTDTSAITKQSIAPELDSQPMLVNLISGTKNVCLYNLQNGTKQQLTLKDYPYNFDRANWTQIPSKDKKANTTSILFCGGTCNGVLRSAHLCHFDDEGTVCLAETSEMLEARFAHGIASMGLKVWVFGGYNTQNMSHCESFDLETQKWTNVAQLPRVSSYNTTVASGFNILVTGFTLTDIYRFIPDSEGLYQPLGVALSVNLTKTVLCSGDRMYVVVEDSMLVCSLEGIVESTVEISDPVGWTPSNFIRYGGSIYFLDRYGTVHKLEPKTSSVQPFTVLM